MHDLDPVAFTVGGFRVWWYGLAYAVGFLGVCSWLLGARRRLGLPAEGALDLAILCAAGVLVFGRAFDVLVYEWSFYREHPLHLLRLWGGGMASHGVLLGGLAAAWTFARWRGSSFLRTADELAIPACFFLALGRIANFINGTIHGTETGVPWAVKFPDAEGYRHPVALYDAAKNLVVLGILVVLRRRSARAGLLMAHFMLWYGFLRVFVDVFRDYGDDPLGIGKGQYFNAAMAAGGLGLIVWVSRRGRAGGGAAGPVERGAFGRPAAPEPRLAAARVAAKVALFVALLVLALGIPDAWTQAAGLWRE